MAWCRFGALGANAVAGPTCRSDFGLAGGFLGGLRGCYTRMGASLQWRTHARIRVSSAILGEGWSLFAHAASVILFQWFGWNGGFDVNSRVMLARGSLFRGLVGLARGVGLCGRPLVGHPLWRRMAGLGSKGTLVWLAVFKEGTASFRLLVASRARRCLDLVLVGFSHCHCRLAKDNRCRSVLTCLSGWENEWQGLGLLVQGCGFMARAWAKPKCWWDV